MKCTHFIPRPTSFKLHEYLLKSDISAARPVRGKCVKGLMCHLRDILNTSVPPAEASLDVSRGQLGSDSKCGVMAQEGRCGEVTPV